MFVCVVDLNIFPLFCVVHVLCSYVVLQSSKNKPMDLYFLHAFSLSLGAGELIFAGRGSIIEIEKC